MTSPNVKQFALTLHKQEEKIAHALPAHLSSGRMIAAVMAQINASPALQSCLRTDVGKQSVIQSIMLAATTGLEPGVLGSAYLIPYYNKTLQSDICTFVPGWRGILDVIGRSGRGLVRSGAVFKGDEFDYETGSAPFVKHKPLSKTSDPKLLTHVYAIGEIAGMQDRIIEVWPIEVVKEHFERFNKVGKKHYAYNHWEMYARKLPVLQVAKYIPRTVEVVTVVAAAYTAERNENLILDEQGRPVNADYRGDDGAPGKPKKPDIVQPRRKEAQDVTPKAKLATDAQKTELKKLAGGKVAVLKPAMKLAGVTQADWDDLTVDQYRSIKEALK